MSEHERRTSDSYRFRRLHHGDIVYLKGLDPRRKESTAAPSPFEVQFKQYRTLLAQAMREGEDIASDTTTALLSTVGRTFDDSVRLEDLLVSNSKGMSESDIRFISAHNRMLSPFYRSPRTDIGTLGELRKRVSDDPDELSNIRNIRLAGLKVAQFISRVFFPYTPESK